MIFFDTGTACGECDKYQVWSEGTARGYYSTLHCSVPSLSYWAWLNDDKAAAQWWAFYRLPFSHFADFCQLPISRPGPNAGYCQGPGALHFQSLALQCNSLVHCIYSLQWNSLLRHNAHWCNIVVITGKPADEQSLQFWVDIWTRIESANTWKISWYFELIFE